MKKLVIANTDSEKRKGLTGSPKGSVGIFNYMEQQPREFVRTDRDLKLYADGKEVGQLTKDNPSVIVPGANQIVEKEFKDGGEASIFGTMYPPAFQQGGSTNLTLAPASYNFNNTPVSGGLSEESPEAVIGINKNMKLKNDSALKYNLGATIGLPYENPLNANLKLNATQDFQTSKMSGTMGAPSVRTTMDLGYDKQEGVNFSLMGNPRFNFGNVSINKYDRPNWRQGTWRAYAGPQLGMSLTSTKSGYTPEGYESDKTKASVQGRPHYGGSAGFEMQPFKTPLKIGADVQLMADPLKKKGENVSGQKDTAGKTEWGFDPSFQVKMSYPIGRNKMKSDEAKDRFDLEDIKVDLTKNDGTPPSDGGSGSIPKLKDKPEEEQTNQIGIGDPVWWENPLSKKAGPANKGQAFPFLSLYNAMSNQNG